MITTVLFDLDGTLADTAPDLANALNATMQSRNLQPLPLSTIRPTVSLGGNAMIKLAFGLEENDPGFDEIRDDFLNYYRNNIANESTLFAGIEQVLQQLEQRNISWGIVTNKTEWLTTPLLQALDIEQRAACVVCGDTTGYRKPHPAPVIHACELMKSKPETTVYIGDAERDIESGRGAGTKTVVALYGYIEEGADPKDWCADDFINTPDDIHECLARLC